MNRDEKPALNRAQKFAVYFGGAMVVFDLLSAVNWHTADEARISRPAFSDFVSAGNPILAAKPIPRETSRSRAIETSVSLSPTERELCRIHKRSNIPLDGELRVQSNPRSDGGRDFLVKSTACPDELYSVVTLDKNGRVAFEIDCQKTSLTELTISCSSQFHIDPAAADPKVRSVALSGPGRLLVNCWDGNLSLTRDGRFNQESAALINSEGCTAWTKKDGGRPVRLGADENLDERGCSSQSRECLEVVEIDDRDVDAFNFKTKNSITVLNERGLRAPRDTIVFPNSVEDLDSPERSLTGVANWEPLPTVRLPSHCPE